MASKLAVCAKAEPMRAKKAAEMGNCILSDFLVCFLLCLACGVGEKKEGINFIRQDKRV